MRYSHETAISAEEIDGPQERERNKCIRARQWSSPGTGLDSPSAALTYIIERFSLMTNKGGVNGNFAAVINAF